MPESKQKHDHNNEDCEINKAMFRYFESHGCTCPQFKKPVEKDYYVCNECLKVKSLSEGKLSTPQPSGGEREKIVTPKAINIIRAKTRHETLEEVWDMMIMSLPPDAENLSTLTPDQGRDVVKGLMKKLKEYSQQKHGSV